MYFRHTCICLDAPQFVLIDVFEEWRMGTIPGIVAALSHVAGSSLRSAMITRV